MKTLAQLRAQTSVDAKPLNELASFNDPPTVLVLRRKAIRLFPGGQRVASYVNDNLDLEIAIPYNPETLGHKKITTSVANESTEHVPFNKGDLLMQIDERFSPGDKVEIHRMYGLQLTYPILGRVKRAIGDGLYHVETQHTAVTTAHGLLFPQGKHNTHEHNMRIVESLDEATSDNLFGMYLKHHHTPIHFNDRNFKPLKKIEAVVSQRYGAPALKHFQLAAVHHQDGDLDKANHHYAKYKAAADQLGESTNNESIMEATIHALHTITRTKTPAVVRFRNHATAMVHHATAAQIMKLYSQMKAANKRKIEAMVNGSPEAMKKVHDFALAHMKG